MTLAVGSQLGIFEITGKLGVGGMGEVYRATDTTLGRDVAIKTLPAALASDKDRLARFEREAKLLASLNHAHIAAVYGLDEHDGTRFIAMELVEGESLEDRLKQGPIRVETTLKIALQIAEALEAAHGKGVVHRDLKPANVMLTADGVVKVLDFGLAKAFSGDPNAASPAHSPALSLAMTQQGLILGTAGYMSPEQASGQATDQRADIWAFGVVLYEMLTGAPLFDGQSVPHILADVLRSEPDWTRLPKALNSRLKLLLERCLAKEPRNRLHAMADARIEIQAALLAPAEAPAERPAARGAALPYGVAAAVAVLAALAGAAAIWVLKLAEPAEVVRFDHELPNSSVFQFTDYPPVAVSPDGRKLAFVTSDGIYLLSVDQLEAQLIPGTQPAANVMFSPDGEWLGYLNTIDLQLLKVPIGGGGSVPLTGTSLTAAFQGATWTTKDWIVFAQGSTVLRVPASGGEPEVLFDVPGVNVRMPQMLPDGSAILYTVQAGAATQTIIRPLESGEPELSSPGGWARYVPGGYLVYALDDSLFARRFDASTRTFIGGPVPMVENVTSGFGPSFDVSASGSLVYMPAGVGDTQERMLGIVSADGSVQQLAGLPPARYSSPRVSPDGARLVVQTTDGAPFDTRTARIWIYDLSGETALRPLTQQSGKNFQPIWTPDGERITFASDRDGPVSIYWQAADGSGVPERLTTAEAGTEHWPDAWSPDGRTLIYQVVTGSDYDLWSLSLDSPDSARPLVDGTQRQHGAAFSPNGRWLAYGSNEDSPEAEQIFVQPFPSTGEIYQITRESGAFPVWSPDGATLSYRRRVLTGAAESRSILVRTDIVGGERFAWREERELPFRGFLVFGGVRDYDVLPDGQRFVMLFPADDAAAVAERPRVNVVLNWLEELERRLPSN